MADDRRNDDRDDASGQASLPEQSGPDRKSLSDETVEEVKKEILFGVGYKRPPKQHQFKKGQSGNPKGRPRIVEGDRSANTLALKEAKRLVTVREGEEIKKIPAIEAVFRSQIASALKGNAYAQKQNIERYARAERERTREISERNEIWERYVDRWQEQIAEAERKGETPPTPLPHPDDVLIDPIKGVRFVGPVVEEQLHQLEETRRMRDMLIMQAALDQREVSNPNTDDTLDKPGTALLFAVMLNESVPDRFKLSDDEIAVRLLRYACTPKRQLLKDVYRGWRSLGVHRPRGKVFPPAQIGVENFELLVDLAQRFQEGRLDIDNPPEELQAEIAAIILERQQAEV